MPVRTQTAQRRYKNELESLKVSFPSASFQQIQAMCGCYHEHLKFLEQQCHVNIQQKDHSFYIYGAADTIDKVGSYLYQLSQRIDEGNNIDLTILKDIVFHENPSKASRLLCTPMHASQKEYLKKINKNTITFGVGPAGTGKTYLAVAQAVAALEQKHVQKIILTRPAVEAGEKLGYLPGDMSEKVDPYLRPLFDALNDFLGAASTARLIEQEIIEIAPLAFMRGRTLAKSFIILDEAQNTTVSQMKMFLSRIGEQSKIVITGDVSQVDLPSQTVSGLTHALSILQDIDEIAFHLFSQDDVVRHPLIAKILSAYEQA